MKKILPLVAIALAIMSSNVQAHVGQGMHLSFVHGFAHPFGGLDHVLAMLAVGLFASLLGGKARWLVPASFVTMMIAGGFFASVGVQVPLVEIAIAGSVLALGAIVALQWQAPVSLAMALVGFFAIFHGFAHGAEMPVSASSIGYGLGFVAATIALHVTGLALGLTIKSSSKVLPVGGSAIGLAGVGLLSGWF
jgi:urease accessory protein